MPSKIDYRAISQKAINSQRVQSAMKARAKKAFNKAKAGMLNDFLNDIVTREIRGGAEATNKSGMLGGYGNLFSYIGFYSGEDPIGPVENYLRYFSFFARVTKTKSARGGGSVTFSINWPSIEEIYALSPMPWEPGNSWIRGIEKGISGFSHYMHMQHPASRSGGGLQSKKEQGLVPFFSTRDYLPKMLERGTKRFKKL